MTYQEIILTFKEVHNKLFCIFGVESSFLFFSWFSLDNKSVFGKPL